MKPGIAVLLVAAASLASIVGFELASPDPKTPPLPGARAPAIAAAPPAAPPDRMAEWVSIILARPLFEADRRQPSGAVAAPAAAQPAPWPRVTGILVSSGSKIAIFSGGADGRPIVAVEGTRIGLYTVQAIRAGEVTVIGPQGSRILRPAFDASSQRPAAPPNASPPSTAIGRFGLPSLPGLPALPPLSGAAAPSGAAIPPTNLGVGIPGLTALGAPPSLSNPAQTGQESAR